MKPQESGIRSQESGARGPESDAPADEGRRGALNPAPCDLIPDQEDPRLVDAVREYTRALEAGQKPVQQEFLARYPAIAGPLVECLDAVEFVNSVRPHLEEPGVGGEAPTTTAPVPVDLATPLGDFRLLREIGRGGMGVVYEAEQLSLGRRIALKVLPFALTLDSRQLQRFKNEARAAAHLHHSNIVPIYSVGCERGVHFYAMQFIDGKSLSAVIEELRQLVRRPFGSNAPENHPTIPYFASHSERGKGQGSADPAAQPPDAMPVSTVTTPRMAGTTLPSTSGPAFFRTVARFGVQAALALEHAHQLGVVHRDIKPGNLLLDSNGQLWVTDFGLAQFQSDAALTLTGDLLGTLRYMSPEQALARRGLVDHRTDIYSLGATLYELLTLEPAFDGCDRQELLRQITFEEPRSLRRRSRAIPVDLETIVLKALAKRVEDRYSTAQELADDLRRYLDQKPIQARRPAPWERAAKWARRHRGFVTSALALLIVLLVGFAVSTVLIGAAYDRLKHQEAQTKAAYEAEAQQHALAGRNFLQARQMLDFFTQVSEEELADKPGVQDVRRKLLEKALDYYQGFIAQHGDEPSIRDELAGSYQHVAAILHEIGTGADALAALEQARHLLAKQVRDDPTAEHRIWLFAVELYLRSLRDGNRLLLLTQRPVQKELKFSQEQVQQVMQLAGRQREILHEQPDSGLDEWRAKLETMADQETALIRQLGPEQQKRLEQLALQQAGAAAFSNPRVVAALRLTAEQKEQIRAIQLRRGPRGGPRPGGPRSDGGKRTEEIRNASLEQILALLTAEQKEEWAGLVGEPFRGEIRRGAGFDYRFRPPPRAMRRSWPNRGRPGE
jgi:serine/threonine protein kinase